MRLDIDELARRYRLGEELTWRVTPEYVKDVSKMIDDMLDKPRAKGRDSESLARVSVASRAMEYILRDSVKGLELIPFVKGRRYGADILDTIKRCRIDVKTQFWLQKTWEPDIDHLGNLLETYRMGEVDYVLTGFSQRRGDTFTCMFSQLIPVEMIFKGVPPERTDDVEGWLSPMFMEKSDKDRKGNRYFFKNDVAVASGHSARVLKSWQGRPIETN